MKFKTLLFVGMGEAFPCVICGSIPRLLALPDPPLLVILPRRIPKAGEGHAMHPILWVVPVIGARINGFSVMFLLAVLGAVGLTAWRAKREGMDPNDVLDLAPWLSLGGLIGARAVFIAMHPETVQEFADIFRIWKGGIVFYGCILGGLLGSLLFWRGVGFHSCRCATPSPRRSAWAWRWAGSDAGSMDAAMENCPAFPGPSASRPARRRGRDTSTMG